jgi:alpha-ketoglutarate-dependent taurine dioxygenase
VRPVTTIRRARPVDAHSLVNERVLHAGQPPLLLEPAADGVRLDAWLASNRNRVDVLLARHGAVLCRGFALRTQHDFQAAVAATGVQLMEYVEGATPRTALGDRIYTSTEFPPEHPIALHNELSYVRSWPMRIFFFCETAPPERGATPIADVRRVLAQIAPDVRQTFERLGWSLVRNYGTGLGPGWQSAFHARERAEVEAYCREAGVQCEWRGEALRTTHRRPAVRTHPRTGERVWFNHAAFWHLSSLPDGVRARFAAEFRPGELPYATYYGDGSVIPDAVAAELRRAYDAETVAVPWREGDLLILDNMLVAHGREPFRGPRRILTAMGNPSPVEATA